MWSLLIWWPEPRERWLWCILYPVWMKSGECQAVLHCYEPMQRECIQTWLYHFIYYKLLTYLFALQPCLRFWPSCCLLPPGRIWSVCAYGLAGSGHGQRLKVTGHVFCIQCCSHSYLKIYLYHIRVNRYILEHNTTCQHPFWNQSGFGWFPCFWYFLFSEVFMVGCFIVVLLVGNIAWKFLESELKTWVYSGVILCSCLYSFVLCMHTTCLEENFILQITFLSTYWSFQVFRYSYLYLPHLFRRVF